MNNIKIFTSLIIIFLFSIDIIAQNCGLENPSFESNLACPTGHSQFTLVNDWENAVDNLLSTPDYFNCGMTGFIASGVQVRNNAMGQYCQNDGFAGLFLNYNKSRPSL